MKRLQYFYLYALPIGTLAMSACSDFEEVNTDPSASNLEQARVEYAINKSITETQQNPEVAERCFVLNWQSAARQIDPNTNGGLSVGLYDDGWIENYYSHFSGWMSPIVLAINLAEEKMKGELNAHEAEMIPNLKQVARIWRVYLMSEFTDSFGVMPIESFTGKNPEFNSCKDVYYFMLEELKDAVSKIKTDVKPNNAEKGCDRAYGFDFNKWVRYANSMRMRLAMRLSEVDPQKAKTEFEAAATAQYIDNLADNFAVKENLGWDALTGVMTREWNNFPISATLNNLFVGLGGITSADQLKERTDLLPHIKPEGYMGVQYLDHMALNTNDPAKGFWFDGLHNVIDPRAYALYTIPGDLDNPRYCKYPSWNSRYKELKRKLLKNKEDADGLVELDATFTWNASACGEWGDRGSLNKMYYWPWALPRLEIKYRDGTNSRIFFASWESYFLLAEAAVRGWNVPLSAKDAYEKGIMESFKYHKVDEYIGSYLASENYNNVGTSVKWEHTAEPAPKTITAVNGYTGEAISDTYAYPVAANTLYGKALNDHLTKIITQKYIANMPWLPLESWNDQRRLGLPFFETPAVEKAIPTMPSLTADSYMKQTVKFFPQRMKFPSTLSNSSPDAYAKAVQLLGGEDGVFTPIWWAKQQ
ncbi:SusD/RagB family nutrient-binding outer membrane lipoprotein [Alloprevotella sp. OH1205_COT-284]|uniref:SusD/RagB family nutrient-binding outer membrane lipoprotein n=1 Tax=Alloprevotella sp. OH1205_COT-284 TaxID=2491043 RepID=UPI000F5FE9E5|nr:SusD/RagB family nutrient-binding outer membrane lipoprotein [Alloprevotella sp. OH1205_COT-284]RRD79829.1 SusD/RagB family nutrient-binding outer membrane lipoprotein [Alloprevotella sp. OH1205_COT-284]